MIKQFQSASPSLSRDMWEDHMIQNSEVFWDAYIMFKKYKRWQGIKAKNKTKQTRMPYILSHFFLTFISFALALWVRMVKVMHEVSRESISGYIVSESTIGCVNYISFVTNNLCEMHKSYLMLTGLCDF